MPEEIFTSKATTLKILKNKLAKKIYHCYENDEVLVGTHNVIEPNASDSSVMFIAKIKDGKVISHQYLREFDR